MPTLRSLFLLVLLGIASTALALRIQDEMQRPPETPDSVVLDAAASDQAIEIPELPKFEAPPIERFKAAFERPLFSATRRPAADEPVVTAVAEGQVLSATLQGILFASSGSVAVLTVVGESTPVSVSQGELFRGWRLLEIHPDNVVFEKDEETVTLELIYKAQSAPAVVPRKLRP